MKRISDEYSPVRKSQTVYGSISVNYAFRGEKTIWCECHVVQISGESYRLRDKKRIGIQPQVET